MMQYLCASCNGVLDGRICNYAAEGYAIAGES
jgi:hypothetical protein